MRWISDSEVGARLTLERCIQLMDGVFRSLGRGEALQPLRTALAPPGVQGLLGLMPGALLPEGVMGAKLLSVFPANHQAGLPSHQGVIVLFATRDGRLLATCEAGKITALRTAAVSAVATPALARKDAGTLAILGAGVQGEHHLAAMTHVRAIRSARVWDQSLERATRFAEAATRQYGFPIEAVPTAEAAVRNADLICTVTPARAPILESAWVAPGAHLNAVGACTPSARELDSSLMARARVFTDRKASLLNEAGDYLIPLQEGRFKADHLTGELGDLLLGRIQGRISPGEVTVFKALGLAVEDLALAWELCHGEQPEATASGASLDP